jgi:hypothetical protein
VVQEVGTATGQRRNRPSVVLKLDTDEFAVAV